MLLKIEDLAVKVDGKPILHDINLFIDKGETHALLGPNGGGKTTLLMTIMGMPKYSVTKGKIIFKGKNVTDYPVDERARLGISLSFQRPPQIRGIKTKQIVEISMGKEDPLLLHEMAEKLNVTEMLDRDVNVGFSGGEIKRTELLQLLAMDPDLAMFDEPESGVDLDNIALVGEAMAELLGKYKVRQNRKSGLIVTHTGHILDYVNADKGHVLINGTMVCSGNPRDLFNDIRAHGYERCVSCYNF